MQISNCKDRKKIYNYYHLARKMFSELRNNILLKAVQRPARGLAAQGTGRKIALYTLVFYFFALLSSSIAIAQSPDRGHPLKKTLPPASLKRQASDSTHGTITAIRRPATSDTHSIAITPDSTGHSEQLIPLSPNAITDIIHYRATDSIAIAIEQKQATLYKEGNIDYDGMVLKADNIEVDFDHQTLSARGSVDTTGKYIGRPLFKQDETEYNADTLVFNYQTKKGIITGIITQEGEGFLHGSKVKKINDSVMYLNSGLYTTCNYAHPHYAINFSKSKLITGNMILTGPAYVSIEDIPTPLAVPFAFLPMVKGRSSGILMPSYGWMSGRGYYLKDGGYYLAINDYMDLSLMGELYTNLSWKGEVKSNYYKRYRYRGTLDVAYGRYRQGIKEDTANYNVFSDFKVSWQHNQDAKANPRSRFSANVNMQSRNYNKTTTNHNDYFNSTTTSSISYSTSLGRLFNLSAAFNESFNSQTGLMNLKLPTLSLSSTTLYPFRNPKSGGTGRWYEDITLNYTLNAGNNISAQDTDILKRSVLNKMQYGISHNASMQSSVKVLRHLNWTNSLNYNERWHWSTIEKHWDSATQRVALDTLRGFRSNRDFSFNSSLSTRLYGMFSFKTPYLKMLRHVIKPSVSFNYTPDFGSDKLGYWHSYTDASGYVHRYSIFEQSLYGGPADGQSGRVSFSVSNSLEAKVKPLRQPDSINELKKMMLIENLAIGISYDMAKDSLRWSDLTINGRTTLLNNLVLNYSGSFIPYVVDTAGRKHNQFLWEADKKLFQRSNSTWSGQLSFSLNNKTFQKKGEQHKASPSQPQYIAPVRQSPYDNNPGLLLGHYADFSMPWNLSINYTLSYVSTYEAAKYNFTTNTIHNLSLSGNLTLTEKWRFSFSTGYDFSNKGISYTSIDVYRDLHCWEVRFNWVPFGYYKSWNFCINIKADALRDVKWNPKKTYQDNDTYQLY